MCAASAGACGARAAEVRREQRACAACKKHALPKVERRQRECDARSLINGCAGRNARAPHLTSARAALGLPISGQVRRDQAIATRVGSSSAQHLRHILRWPHPRRSRSVRCTCADLATRASHAKELGTPAAQFHDACGAHAQAMCCALAQVRRKHHDICGARNRKLGTCAGFPHKTSWILRTIHYGCLCRTCPSAALVRKCAASTTKL